MTAEQPLAGQEMRLAHCRLCPGPVHLLSPTSVLVESSRTDLYDDVVDVDVTSFSALDVVLVVYECVTRTHCEALDVVEI